MRYCVRKGASKGLSAQDSLAMAAADAPEAAKVKNSQHRLRAAFGVHLRQRLVHEEDAQTFSLLRAT